MPIKAHEKKSCNSKQLFFSYVFSDVIGDTVLFAEIFGDDEKVGMEEGLPLFFEQQVADFAVEARGGTWRGEDGSKAVAGSRRLRVGKGLHGAGLFGIVDVWERDVTLKVFFDAHGMVEGSIVTLLCFEGKDAARDGVDIGGDDVGAGDRRGEVGEFDVHGG